MRGQLLNRLQLRGRHGLAILGHEQTVGTGKSPEGAKESRLAAPSGLTGASKTAGVPDYKGGGHLEQGLKKLYP